VAKEDVLARIDRDLSQGLTHPALQRLRTLTEAYPQDLDLRARRAAVCRQVGNVVEAGRWGFLTEQVKPDELAAFERAFPHPFVRLRTLRLRGRPATLGPAAGERLNQLIDEASTEGPLEWTAAGPQPTPTTGWIDALMGIGCGASLLALAALIFVGLITTVHALF
jgi:Family of unknown function (DUF6584)